MRRRAFIVGLCGAAAWPVVARVQPAMPVIGLLSGASLDDMQPAVAGFRQALKEAGYIEGKNVVIEYRWAQNKIESLPWIGCRFGQAAGNCDRRAWQHAREPTSPMTLPTSRPERRFAQNQAHTVRSTSR